MFLPKPLATHVVQHFWQFLKDTTQLRRLCDDHLDDEFAAETENTSDDDSFHKQIATNQRYARSPPGTGKGPGVGSGGRSLMLVPTGTTLAPYLDYVSIGRFQFPSGRVRLTCIIAPRW